MIAAIALPSVTASIYFYSASTIKKSIPTISDPPASSTASCDQLVDITDSLNIKTLKISNGQENATPLVKFSYQRAFALLWLHFQSSYSNSNLVMWSVWWAFDTCAMGQVKHFKNNMIYSYNKDLCF